MVGRRLISGRQALGVEYDMRNGLYGQLVRLRFGFYDRHQTGQLMSRATVDLQAVRFFLGYGLIFFSQHIITILAVSVVLFVIDSRLALIALAVTPLIVAIAYRYSHVSHPVLRDVQQKLADVATVAEESSSASTSSSRSRRSPRAGALRRRDRERLRAEPPREPAARAVRADAGRSCRRRAGRRAARGAAGWSCTARSRSATSSLQPAAGDAGHAAADARDVDRAGAARDRVRRAHLRDPRRAGGDRRAAGRARAAAGPGELRFEGVGFGYDTGRAVLRGIDLEIPAGRTVALIGPTGSGKTTLASLVPRFYDATEGRVLVDGVDVREVTLDARCAARSASSPRSRSCSRPRCATTSRSASRRDRTRRSSRPRARRRRTSSSSELPDGYDTVVGERGITLSGGQRQRIAIARALLIDPRILILDDATASVDATTEAQIRAGLREAMRGRTTIIIAHRLSTIALADEVVVLDEGRIAARGTHDELLETSAVYREIYDHGLLAAQLARQPRMRVWQAGSHLMERAGAPQVQDWSGAQTRRRLADPRPDGDAVPRPHGARARDAAPLHARRTGAAVPGEARGRPRDRATATSPR